MIFQRYLDLVCLSSPAPTRGLPTSASRWRIRPHRGTRRPWRIRVPTLALVGALVLDFMTGSRTAQAADHRETDSIAHQPGADITDLYVFRSPADDSKLVFFMGVNPLAVPSENISYLFSPDVLYEILIDSDGDLAADTTLSLVFGPRRPDSSQRVTLQVRGLLNTTFGGFTTPPSEAEAAPADVVVTDPGDVNRKLFCGLKDDPFFFDVAAFNRFLGGGALRNPGVDGFAGLNVSAMVIEVPATQIATDGSNLGVWCQTSRLGPGNRRTRLQRMGRPAIKTVLIPRGSREAFNTSEPATDSANFRSVLVTSIQGLGRSADDAGALADQLLPDVLTIDIAQPTAFLNGRALADDVIDAELTLLLGTPTADNVNANDLTFADAFPYLAGPHQP